MNGSNGLNWTGRGDEEGEGVGIDALDPSGDDTGMSSSVGGGDGGSVGGSGGGGGVYEVDQMSFDHLVLSTDMLSAHLNNAYKTAIQATTTTTTTTTVTV